MARKITLLGIIILLAVTGGFILSAQMKPGDRPPGGSPAMWIPLTQTSGIVLREPIADRDRILNHGTLMVKVHDAWREVYLDVTPSGLMPVKP